MLKIVTDSACDVPDELARALDITVVPVFINIGEKSYIDGVEMTRAQFYEQLSSFPQPPTTAAPSVGTFAETYQKLAAAGATRIISVHVSAALSNTFNAARLGAEAARGVDVKLIDSQQVTAAAGLLVIAAAEAVARGASFDEVMRLLKQNIPNGRIFGIIDNLESLRRSGRVSWAQFGFGTLLQIKPIMMIANGEIDVIGRARTMRKALPHTLKLVEQFAPFERIAVLHAQAPDLAETLRAQAQDRFHLEEMPIMEIGPAVGTHMGAGAVGFGTISKEKQVDSL